MVLKKSSYFQVTPETYDKLMTRYAKYLDALDDVTKDPVKVFDPLPKKFLDELELIREVSKDLQKKKEEDINKAAQAAKQEAEEAAKKEAEEAAKKAAEDKEKDAAEQENKTE